MRFEEACGIYRSDGMVKTIPQIGPLPPPVGRPRGFGGPHREWMMTFFSRLLSFADRFPNARALVKRLFRPCGSYRSDVSLHLLPLARGSRFRSGRVPGYRTRRKEHAFPIVRDEFRPAIPRSGCSPALPVSASPAPADYHALLNRTGKRGHFYFAQRGTFLFCVDKPRFYP